MNNYYVYGHFCKSNNELFYIGKGKGSRAISKQHRNTFWRNIVNKHGYYIEIFKQNLSEADALKLEVKLILKYKKLGLCKSNLTKGGEGLSGFNHSQDTKNKLSKHFTGTSRGPHKLESRQKMCKTGLFNVYRAIKSSGKGLGKGRQRITKGEFIGTWLSGGVCADDLNISRQCVYRCLSGGRPSGKGYIFEYQRPTCKPNK